MSPPFQSSLQGDREQPFGAGTEHFPLVPVSKLGLSLTGGPDPMRHKNGKDKALAWIVTAITHRDPTLNHHLLPLWHCFSVRTHVLHAQKLS